QLLKHAHKRLESQSPAEMEAWNKAVATLREGDHYILVMVGGLPWLAIAKFSIRLFVSIAAIVAIILLLRRMVGPLPRAGSYVFFALFIALYLAGVLMSRRNTPNPLARVGKAITTYLFGEW